MIKEKVIEAIADFTSKEVSEISGETKFSDLGIDSLDVAELAMNLEDEFEVELKVDETIVTVDDLVAKIEAAKA